MTEHIVDKALADNPAPNSQGPVEEQPRLLRQARERAGMHLAAVAVALKVPVARLEALEAGRYHELPDPTFVRALAKSVCKVLKVDPTPILASLPSGHVPDLGLASGAVSTPMPSRRRSTLLGGSEAVIPVPASVLVAMVLLTLAIAFWFWLPERNVDASTSEALPVALAPLEQTLPQTPAVEVPPLAQPQTVPPATDSSPIPIVDGILQLKAADSAWVQVVGASKRVLLQRSLEPQEALTFSQDLPITVVIGRADQVTVLVRGQVFDLQPWTRANVARFEVQ